MYDASSEILKYSQISSLLLVLGIVLAVVAVGMFFKFRIMQVFDRVTGRGEQKEREKIGRINAKLTSNTGKTGDVSDYPSDDLDDYNPKDEFSSAEDLSEFKDNELDNELNISEARQEPIGEKYVKAIKDKTIRTGVPAERNEKTEISQDDTNRSFVQKNDADETAYLEDSETGLLDDEETGLLDEETGLLDKDTAVLDEETGLLSTYAEHEPESDKTNRKPVRPGKFEIISEEIIVYDDGE